MSAAALLGRAALIVVNALVAAAVTTAALAWLALRIDWEVPDPRALAGPSTVRARDGSVLARFDAEVDRRVVPLHAVSPAAVAAVVAAEDSRFYEHRGVDVVALLRAVATNVRTGSVRQGGSTITQQYVKNAFVGGDRTVVRKVREALISIQLERELTKEEILERYLNTIYFGEGAYGIEAAALTYFGVPAADLDAGQAAALVQALPAPSVTNARADPSGARARRDRLLARMEELGLIAAEQARSGTTAGLEVRPTPPRRVRHPHFVAYVTGVVEAALGRDALDRGALEVRTTLDPSAQAALESAVARHLPDPETNVEAGAVAIDPRTGDVLAMYGGRDFYADTSRYSATDYAQVNLATHGRRQPGSTFKPFVLAAALEEGRTLTSRYPAPASLDVGGHRVRNANRRGYGRLTLRQAVVNSVNTVYARLGMDVGPERVVDVAARLGVRTPIDPAPLVGIGGVARGPTVLDMASAYATFANDGVACPARTVVEVRGPGGRLLPPLPERVPPSALLDARPEDLRRGGTPGRCYRAVDADVARSVTIALRAAVESGTGRRARIGRPQAGKTGTTDDYNDAWFVGYTPNLSLAVWLGDPDEKRPLTRVGGVARVFGGTLPALIWRDAARAVLDDVEDEDFPRPAAPDRRRVRPAMPFPPARSPTPTPSPTPPSPTRSPQVSSPSPSPSPTATGTAACLPPLVACD